jgi:hypothetical protein
MAQQPKHPAGPPASTKVDQDGALSDAALEQVSGGTEPMAATSTSNIMKTKHDTVKNSISNVR